MSTISFPIPYRSAAGFRIGGAILQLEDISGEEAPIVVRVPILDADTSIDYRLHRGELWEPVVDRQHVPLKAVGDAAGSHEIFRSGAALSKMLDLNSTAFPVISISGIALTQRHINSPMRDADDMSDDLLASEQFARIELASRQYRVIGGELHRQSPGPIMMAKLVNSPNHSNRWLTTATALEHPWSRASAYSVTEADAAFAITGEGPTFRTYGDPAILGDVPVKSLLHCAIEGAAIQLLAAASSMPPYSGRSLVSAVMDLRSLLAARAPGGKLAQEAGPYYMFDRPYVSWHAQHAMGLVEPMARLMTASPDMRNRYGVIHRFIKRRVEAQPAPMLDSDDLDRLLSAPH